MVGPSSKERRHSSWPRVLIGLAAMIVTVKLVSQWSSNSQQLSTEVRGGASGAAEQAAEQAAAVAAAAGGSGGAAGIDAPSPVPAMVDAFVASPLPPRNLNLTERAPLFFFHQRKAAGSSMRAGIVDAAKAANLTYYVPCFNNVPCDTYRIHVHKAAVFAGHFTWGEQRELSRRSRFDPDTGAWHNPRHNASCLTIFRDPVARLESCYYFRFVQERNIRDGHYSCLSNLKAAEVRYMYAAGRTLYGRGCLNEPFRILSGMADELDLAALSRSSLAAGSSLTAALSLTLRHLSGCVPVVLEDPRSLRLAQHWFPQLAPAFESLGHGNKGLARRCPLSDRMRGLLEELAVGERVIYDAARRRVERMLAELAPAGATGLHAHAAGSGSATM